MPMCWGPELLRELRHGAIEAAAAAQQARAGLGTCVGRREGTHKSGVGAAEPQAATKAAMRTGTAILAAPSQRLQGPSVRHPAQANKSPPTHAQQTDAPLTPPGAPARPVPGALRPRRPRRAQLAAVGLRLRTQPRVQSRGGGVGVDTLPRHGCAEAAAHLGPRPCGFVVSRLSRLVLKFRRAKHASHPPIPAANPASPTPPHPPAANHAPDPNADFLAPAPGGDGAFRLVALKAIQPGEEVGGCCPIGGGFRRPGLAVRPRGLGRRPRVAYQAAGSNTNEPTPQRENPLRFPYPIPGRRATQTSASWRSTVGGGRGSTVGEGNTMVPAAAPPPHRARSGLGCCVPVRARAGVRLFRKARRWSRC